jgi:hypothetical protein
MPKDSPKTASERPPTLLYWTFWAGNLADWRIPELHYEGDFGKAVGKGGFPAARNFVGVALLESPNAAPMPDAKLRQGPDWPGRRRTGPEPSPDRLQIGLSTAN